jgi:hypothetical protein
MFGETLTCQQCGKKTDQVFYREDNFKRCFGCSMAHEAKNRNDELGPKFMLGLFVGAMLLLSKGVL